MATIVDILYFMLSWVEYEINFIASGPGVKLFTNTEIFRLNLLGMFLL